MFLLPFMKRFSKTDAAFFHFPPADVPYTSDLNEIYALDKMLCCLTKLSRYSPLLSYIDKDIIKIMWLTVIDK